MIKLLQCSSLAACLLVATSPFSLAQTNAPPPMATGGPKPFLSACTKLVVSNAVKKTVDIRIRPTKDGVEEPFYDVPFALHVPVEVRHEGGPACVVWRITISWENPSQEWYEQSYDPSTKARGFYPLNGKQPPPDSVRWGGAPLKWEDDVPVPTFARVGSYVVRDLKKEQHEPFGTVGDSDSYVLEPSTPGWYALWFAFDLSGIWPAKEPKRDTIRGTLHIDTVVSRSVRDPSDEVIAYLFGRGKRPEEIKEDKFYRAATIDLPFKLRRDGWEFDHAELRVVDRNKVEKKRIQHPRAYDNYEFQQKIGGKVVEMRVVERFQREPRVEVTDAPMPDKDELWDVVYIVESIWQASFPPSIPDNSFGIVKLEGKRDERFKQKPDWKPEGTWSTYRWDPTSTDVYKENSTEREKAGEHQSRALDPMEKRWESGVGEIRQRFLNDYGNDAAEWFVPGFHEDLMTGPKQGEPPYQYVVRGRYPQRKDADTAEIGAYPLLAYRVGPWNLIGFYKRLSEIEGRVVASKVQAGEATIVSDVDDFWKWFVKFGFLLGQQFPIATLAQINATQEAVPLPGLLQSRDRLRFVLQPDAGLPPWRGMQPVWDAKDKIWHWADNELPKLNIGTLPGGSEPGSVNKPVATSPELAARMQKKLQEILAQISQHRTAISKHTDEARAAYDVILAELDAAYQTYGGPGHPELTLWRIDYRKARERVPLDIARSSNDPEFLKKALAESAIEGASPDTRVLEAKLHVLSGDAIAAVEALWRALNVETNHPAARQMLADLECAFLQRSIEKSQGAIAEARKHFYGYLLERGFSDTDIISSKTNRLDWMATRIGVYGEEAWAAFTTGLFGSFSAFYGKPAAEADLLATTERQMTTAFVGLHTMRLLRKKGVTFAEMQKLTSTQMRDKIGMVRSDADAANLGVAVREAMKLPDVQAMMAGNREALEAGMKQGYWDSADVSNTWIEWYGDLTSAYNLFTLLLPAAKSGTAGRTSGLMWTKAETAMVGELQTLGVVKSGTEVVATSIGITRGLNAIGATERGKKVMQHLEQLEKYQAGLGLGDKVVWTTGKITGALTFGLVTVTATEHLVGHKAAMLVQAALLFATDTELLVKLLKARNIPPDKIAKLIINDYIPATKVHLKRLAYAEKSTFELEELLTRVKAGNKLSADDFTILNRYFGSNWRTITPGAVASENAAIAVNAAAESLRNGVDNGALQAAKELKPALQAEAKATTQTLQEQQKVADALNAAAPDAAPPVVQQPATPTRGPPIPDKPITAKFGVPAQPAAPPPPPKKLRPPPATPEYPPSGQRVLPEETRAAKELGAYVIHPPLRPTSRTAEALQALHNGQFAAAERKIIQIQDDIRSGLLREADEMTMERLHVWRMVANDLQRVTRKTPKPGSSVINTAIPAATVEEVLSKPGMLKPKTTTGAMSTVFEVEGHPDLFVKHIKHEFERWNKKLGKMETVNINILEDVENNLLHEQLARAMGFDVPAMEARIIYDANGKEVEAYYVMRKVEGTPLANMTAGEIFLYREELARHKALATLIGDFDRKLDNYIITAEGHFVPIDAGMGDAAGTRLSREMAKEGYEFAADAPFSIDGVYGRDHWYAKSIAEAPGKEILSHEKTLFRKFLIGEESMTFQGAEPVVIEIEKFFVNGAKAADAKKAIRDAYIRMYLPERVKKLASLKNLNAADPAVLAGLEQEAMRSLESKLDQAIEAVETNLKARAPKIRDSMKGLNDHNGQPLFETDVSGALRLDDDFIIRFTLQYFLNTTTNRRAA